MRELGVWTQCQYPGFSNDPDDAFAGLAHDLSFAEEFFGSAVILQRAAEKELLQMDERQLRDGFVYSGDADRVEEVRQLFREGKYDVVLTVATKFRNADLIPEAVSKMIRIAAKKAGKLIP